MESVVDEEENECSGVVYLSRIPPRMTPQTLRQLLGVIGEVGRVYLVPRKQNKGRKEFGQGGFEEGWVEFPNRKDAKRAAVSLNCTRIGPRKGSAFYDDLWMLKYLPKFRWSHLTGQLAYERAIREQRLNAEVSRTRRENEFYLRQADRAHGMEISARKRKQNMDIDVETQETPFKQRFRQRAPHIEEE